MSNPLYAAAGDRGGLLSSTRAAPPPFSILGLRPTIYGPALLAVLALSIGLGVGLRAKAPSSGPSTPFLALATMTNGSLSGTVAFSSASADGPVTITVNLRGFPAGSDGLKGFHIHANVLDKSAPLDSLCMAAGSHFNPFGRNHSCPGVAEGHAGDLGSIQVVGGAVSHTITSSAISLAPGAATSVLLRALIVHADVDDCGKGGVPASLTTGNSGARILCAVIVPSTSAA